MDPHELETNVKKVTLRRETRKGTFRTHSGTLTTVHLREFRRSRDTLYRPVFGTPSHLDVPSKGDSEISDNYYTHPLLMNYRNHRIMFRLTSVKEPRDTSFMNGNR